MGKNLDRLDITHGGSGRAHEGSEEPIECEGCQVSTLYGTLWATLNYNNHTFCYIFILVMLGAYDPMASLAHRATPMR